MWILIKRGKSVLCKALLLGVLSACVPSPQAKMPERSPDVTGAFSEVAGLFKEAQQTVMGTVDSLSTQQATGIRSDLRNVKVGLLIPLSGATADVGKQLQDAATLAVFDARIDGLAPVDITLIPRDTATSSTQATQAAGEVISLGAERIVGPLFSQSVTEVAKIAAPRGVPIIALTNNRQVATTNITVFGFTPEDQVASIVEHSLKSGASHLALLAPNDAYGKVVEAAFKTSTTNKGGVVTTVERYGKTPQNLDAAAKRIAESYRVQPFKALMIADSPATTATLIKAVRQHGLDTSNIQLLGTALLDDAGTRPDASLLGVTYATTSPGNYYAFEKRFASTYGYTPKRISSLAYDAVRLAALPQLEGEYIGRSTGNFRVAADGTIARNLAVVAVSATGFTIIKPAAKEFK